jgi:hypothetical protein
MDVKKIYWYHDGEEIKSSHEVPPYGTQYVEKIISVIGVPDIRAVSIKNSKGELLYNKIENIPLEDNLIEKYLMEVKHGKNT